MGLLIKDSPTQRKVREKMHTVSNIIADIGRGCLSHNMIEDKFSYQITFFVNEGSNGTKHYIDTTYGDLRKTLENIIKGYLTVTNSVVIAQITALKGGRCVSMLSRSYAFSLDEYFCQIYGRCKDDSKNRNIIYGRYAYAVS